MTTNDERRRNMLDRATSVNEHRDTPSQWMLRAATVLGIMANIGYMHDDQPHLQAAIDELFVKMPTELSIVAALNAKQQTQRIEAMDKTDVEALFGNDLDAIRNLPTTEDRK